MLTYKATLPTAAPGVSGHLLGAPSRGSPCSTSWDPLLGNGDRLIGDPGDGEQAGESPATKVHSGPGAEAQPGGCGCSGLRQEPGDTGLRAAWRCHAGDVKGLQVATLRGFEGNGETSLSKEPGRPAAASDPGHSAAEAGCGRAAACRVSGRGAEHVSERTCHLPSRMGGGRPTALRW